MPDQTEANRLIGYHAPRAHALTSERTALESALIPVTAYIVVACLEAFWRYPDLVRTIDAALPAEEIGRRARRPGCQVNTVYLWSAANFWLVGRNALLQLDPARANDAAGAVTVLSFWERCALAYRGDGHRMACDADGTVPVYDQAVLDELVAGSSPVADDDTRRQVKALNATLVNYLFLLYFDTRIGHEDSGPWRLPDGRTLLVRDFYRLGRSDFWWSDVAEDVPYSNLTAALVLDDVSVRISDFGSARTDPEDYLDRLSAFGLFTTDTPDGSLRRVPLEEAGAIVVAIRKAQAQHYRRVAAMDRDEKIRCGAYVYFSALRPFAEIAGVADQLDWTVPRDTPDFLYQIVAQMTGGNQVPDVDPADYYPPMPS